MENCQGIFLRLSIRFIHVFPKNVELNHRNAKLKPRPVRKKRKKEEKKNNTFDREDRRPHEDACLFRTGAACLLACVSHRKRFPPLSRSSMAARVAATPIFWRQVEIFLTTFFFFFFFIRSRHEDNWSRGGRDCCFVRGIFFLAIR